LKKEAYVVFQGKFLQKPTMKMEEDFQVLNLLDAGEEWICQVKEELRRTRIKAERFRAGWTRLPAVGGRRRKRRAKGAFALLLAAAAAKAKREI
jgi:hypothetical protein